MASAAGDAMVTVALAGSVFFSTSVTEARGRVALSLGLTLAPFAVIAPFLGPAIDRSRGGRRFMVAVSAAGRAATALYMATVVDNLLLFLPAALVLLILSKAHAVAKSSLVPGAVSGPDSLVRAGSRLAVLAAAAGLAAGVPAAGILKLAGAAWLLRVAAVIYALGVISAIGVTPVEVIPPPVEPATVRNRRVVDAAVAMAVLRATVGFLTVAVAFDVRTTHANSLWYGAVVAGGLIGGFVGNLVSPALREATREESMISAALIVVALAGVGAWWLGSRFAIAVLAWTVGVAGGVARLAFDAIVQRDGDAALRSRSFARFEAVFQLGWVAAALIPTVIPGRGVPGAVAALVIAAAATIGAVEYIFEGVFTRRFRRAAPAPQVLSPPRPAGFVAPDVGSPPEQSMPESPGPRRNPRRRHGQGAPQHPDG